MMRLVVTAWLLMVFGSARAEPSLDAQQHLTRGQRWSTATRYEKAIEEFEQGYLLDGKPFFLYHMAVSYDRLASMPTRSVSERLDSQQRALELYIAFVEKAPPGEPGLDVARGRVESLRQEVEALKMQTAEREATLKAINDKLDLLINEVRGLRELLLRREHGVRTATPAGLAL